MAQKAWHSHKSSHRCLGKDDNHNSTVRQQRAQEEKIARKNEEQVASAESCGADVSQDSQSGVPSSRAFISASSGAVEELKDHLNNTKRKQSSHRNTPQIGPSVGHFQETQKGRKIHNSSHQRVGKDENFDPKSREQPAQEQKNGNNNEDEAASIDSSGGDCAQDGQSEVPYPGGLISASSGAGEEMRAPSKASGIGHSLATQKAWQHHKCSHHSLGKDDTLDSMFCQQRAEEEKIGNKHDEEGASMDSSGGDCSQDGHSEVPHPGTFRTKNVDGKTLLLEATLVEEADLIVSSIVVTAVPDQRREEYLPSSHIEAMKPIQIVAMKTVRQCKQLTIVVAGILVVVAAISIGSTVVKLSQSDPSQSDLSIGTYPECQFLTSCSKSHQDLQEDIAEGGVVGICGNIQVNSTPLQIVESDVTLVGCCPETKCVISGSAITPNLVVTGGNFKLLNVIIQNGNCDPKSDQGGGNLRSFSNQGQDSYLTIVDSKFHNGLCNVQAGGNVYVEIRGSVTFQRSVFQNGKASKDSSGGAFVTKSFDVLVDEMCAQGESRHWPCF
ncbi:hypothetical protein IV203_018187 [Nitzschia inconspicua]|uniref:Uncharacterized protein n=1 Tax=Nitzschia inconspicua TaxID=303405 RepID=A0A9K3Q8F0_9STRA|nr:hypothetical protein IV203_018187 [Nitzschia inconspicua]